jgi:hypothetical protein
MNRAFALALLAGMLAGCGPSGPAAQAPKGDPAASAGYAQDTERLTNMDRAAERLFQAGRTQEAAAVVTSGRRSRPACWRLRAPRWKPWRRLRISTGFTVNY